CEIIMGDSHNNESEIRQFLEEPSSQLDNENAWLSEDEGWFGNRQTTQTPILLM
ncbi:hypothetical protein J6590_011144, partial [Homalodisca vitripennis]